MQENSILDETDETLVEELESIDDIAEDEDLNNPKLILDNQSFIFETQKFLKASIPVFFMDKKLKVIWLNSESEKYFILESKEEHLYFQKLFYPYLNEKRLQIVYESIFSADKGFSWEGRVEVTGHDRAKGIANLIIFPFFRYERENKKRGPSGYFAIIDDVTEENNLILKNTFRTLLAASKLKDNDTGNHVERVSQYSYKIADALYRMKKYKEINMEFVLNIKFLASMHDVGKIGIPDNILSKPGKLTDEEWQIMREHPINGAFILSSYPDKMAMEIARSHHERWDGTGYPYGLAGENIPVAARIVSIADVYDALRMKRSYKQPYSHEKTLEIMKQQRGIQFDPNIIDIFIKIGKDIEQIYEQLADV